MLPAQLSPTLLEMVIMLVILPDIPNLEENASKAMVKMTPCLSNFFLEGKSPGPKILGVMGMTWVMPYLPMTMVLCLLAVLFRVPPNLEILNWFQLACGTYLFSASTIMALPCGLSVRVGPKTMMPLPWLLTQMTRFTSEDPFRKPRILETINCKARVARTAMSSIWTTMVPCNGLHPS